MSRAPSGDAINRCRDAVDAIQSATSHKFSRDRAELVHLLGSPHIQVSDDLWIVQLFILASRLRHNDIFCHNNTAGYDIAVNQLLITRRALMKTKTEK